MQSYRNIFKLVVTYITETVVLSVVKKKKDANSQKVQI